MTCSTSAPAPASSLARSSTIGRRHASSATEQVPGARFAVGDAQALDFPAACFDAALSLFVLSFVPDLPRAVDEMLRVTRPGGVVAAAVWDYADGMRMLRTFWDAAIAVHPQLAPRDEAQLPLSRPGELGALWRDRGLADVEECALTTDLGFLSFDDFWQPFSLGQGPAGACVAGLTPDERLAIERHLRTVLPAGPFGLPARAWAVRGRV